MDAFLEYATKQKWKVVADGKEVRYLKQLLKVLTPKMKHEDRYGQLDVRMWRWMGQMPIRLRADISCSPRGLWRP